MNTWIPHPLRLIGEHVRLEPLTAAHIPVLADLGAGSAEIWRHLPHRGTDRQATEAELRSAILRRAAGEHYPFTVFDARERVIGSTRFFDLFPEHKKLEIGWTWFIPAAWGTGANAECKALMLRYCFEELGVQRVQLKTRTANLRSLAAIRKLGATQEGILRKDRIATDGTPQDTVVFSITDDDWFSQRRR